MIITVLISVVIVGAVLIPILGEVSDNGGSGDSEKIMLNTFESSIEVDLAPYNSFQYDDSSINSSLPHEITYTLEDLNEISFVDSSQLEDVGDIPILEAYDDSRNGVRIAYVGGEGDIDVVIMHNGSGSGAYISAVTSFDLTISTDYSLDCSYTYVYPAGSDPRTESIQITVTNINQLSESEDGWMYISGDLVNDKIAVGSELLLGVYVEPIDKEWYKPIVITEDMISNNHLQFTVDWGDGYTSDVDLELQSTDTDGVWKFTDNLYIWYGTVKDNGVELNENSYCWNTYISTYGYIQSESGSGSGGMSSTLLGIIPLFVILGILIYAVQYLRPDNKL